MRIERLHETVLEQAEREYANAKREQDYADLVYIAMMTDVDLPSMEEEEAGNGEE